MTSISNNERTIRIIFTICIVLVAAVGYLGSSMFLFIWSASELQILFPAIAFTVIVGGMLSLVFSIIAHATLGMGLRGLARYLVFGVRYWALGKPADQGDSHTIENS
ncbi:hypothetical protein ABNP34_16355 (plasmid) [Glutamicibacter mishrai]|uniref:hypothetical protein n=1 Tax=Glutamicibacter mishrai TaxID=1775880 RepID=UPI0003B6F89B